MGKILLAFDSFKGSLTSREACEAAARGVREALPDADYEIIPIGDGGEGTAAILAQATDAERVALDVEGPLGMPVKAPYYLGSSGRAIIEIAAASGLTLVAEECLDPMRASTYGTGQLIRDALARGARQFIICLGGSATNDAGVGMLRALGYRFLDGHGKETGYVASEIGKIHEVDSSDADPALKEACFTLACDVSNPLCGPMGASRIFGPQKGADERMTLILDKALESFAATVASATGKDYACTPGAGAAGGSALAFLSFMTTRMLPGIELVLETLDFDKRLKEASLVLTGEGRIDRQTCMGKAPGGVLRHALGAGVPVIGIGGGVTKEDIPVLLGAGFEGLFPITSGEIPLREAMLPHIAASNLTRTVARILTPQRGEVPFLKESIR